MPFDPQKHHRRSIRVQGYDYSQPGAYFVTIVTRGRECLFGEITGSEMRLTGAGQAVEDVWFSLPVRYPKIRLGAAVVMPNHFHGIIEIRENEEGGHFVDADPVGAKPVGAIHELPLRDEQDGFNPTMPLRNEQDEANAAADRRRMILPMAVGYLKMNIAKRINAILDSRGCTVWQRNYYEHIIRDDEEYNRIHEYIESNVEHWDEDEENPGKQP